MGKLKDYRCFYDALLRMQYDLCAKYRRINKEATIEEAEEWFYKKSIEGSISLKEDDLNQLQDIVNAFSFLLQNRVPLYTLNDAICAAFLEMCKEMWEEHMDIAAMPDPSVPRVRKYVFDAREDNWNVIPPFIRAIVNGLDELVKNK